MSEMTKVNAGEHQAAKPEPSGSGTEKKIFKEPEISEPEDVFEVTSYFGVVVGSGGPLP
jgi:hypothetical protein